MDNNTMSPADIAALQNGGMGTEGSWIWFLLIFVLLGWGNYGNNVPAPAPAQSANYVTQAEFQAGLNNQATQAQLQSLAQATQQNNYETAQLINGQTTAMLQQNNTNLINAIQGFNQVTQQLQGQTNTLGSKIDQLGYQMDQCCCSIKTQMLNDRLADKNQQLTAAQNAISNYNQSQYLLGNMGRFVAWDGSGSQTTSAVTTAVS